jgi:hypothetical protein
MLLGPITQSWGIHTETVDCHHPKHKEYLEVFLKNYPTANKDAYFAINMVNHEEWYVFDDSAKNTLRCCVMYSITDDILGSKTRNISTPNYGTFESSMRER